MKETMTVLITGGGERGTALRRILVNREHPVGALARRRNEKRAMERPMALRESRLL